MLFKMTVVELLLFPLRVEWSYIYILISYFQFMVFPTLKTNTKNRIFEAETMGTDDIAAFPTKYYFFMLTPFFPSSHNSVTCPVKLQKYLQ